MLDGRPLVFLFGPDVTNVTHPLDLLKEKTRKAGLSDPYIVLMAGGDAAAVWQKAQALNLDGISSYVTQFNPHQLAGVPFQQGIAEPEKNFWKQAHQAKAKMIPPISVGWNPSPREYIDLPWGDQVVTSPTTFDCQILTSIYCSLMPQQPLELQGHVSCVEKLGHPCYVQDPTMDELTSHTASAVRFAADNPAVAESGNTCMNDVKWVFNPYMHCCGFCS